MDVRPPNATYSDDPKCAVEDLVHDYIIDQFCR